MYPHGAITLTNEIMNSPIEDLRVSATLPNRYIEWLDIFNIQFHFISKIFNNAT